MKTLMMVALSCLPVGFAAGCDGCKKTESYSIGEPIEYLPNKLGTTFTYKIETGEVEPLNYKIVLWPRGQGSLTVATRGRYMNAMERKGKKAPTTFLLKLRVKGIAAKQGGLEYPIGVELDVEKDELGVYHEAKQVFWAASPSGRFTWHEVMTYPSDSVNAPSTGSWGGWGEEDGYTTGMLFFGGKPGIAISLDEGDTDALLFAGIGLIPGTDNVGLHFIRSVTAARSKDGIDEASDNDWLHKGFKEDRYFAKGRGLVYLRQTIEGKTSMTWTRLD
jgi:hypothetical protein